MNTNRRLTWWIVNLVCYFIFLAILVGDILPFPANLVKMAAILWTGLIAVHTILLQVLPQPEKEKPKRTYSLSDDGELVELDDTDDAQPAEIRQANAQTQER